MYVGSKNDQMFLCKIIYKAYNKSSFFEYSQSLI